MPVRLVLIALSSLTLPWPFGGHGEVKHVGAWTLVVQSDHFANRVQCRLSRHRIDYQRHAVTFHFSSGEDTSDAVYRMDGGEPVRARDDAAVLARLGFSLHKDDLKNPSGGVVTVPEARLTDGRIVMIETAPNRSPVKFDISGLAAALDAAQKAGCGPDSFNDPGS